MIQRFQSLLLLLAFILLALMICFPLCQFADGSKAYVNDYYPVLVLLLINMVLTAFSFFMYKHRMLQIRLSIFNALIIVGLQGWIIYLFFSIPGNSVVFSLTAACPLAAFILILLAIRYIGRDEALIRSLSRLRK
jgi:hypothetical protein